jgi:hypothetical protein
MSDIRPPMGGQPPMGGRDAMSGNRSIMNPMDTAAMATSGTIKQGMTVRDLIEKVFKVPIDAPVEQLTQAIKRQGQNQTGMGKVGAMAQGAAPPMGQPAPRPAPPPQGRPSASPAPRQGIAELMS